MMLRARVRIPITVRVSASMTLGVLKESNGAAGWAMKTRVWIMGDPKG